MNKCENCKYYIQHYAFYKEYGIFKVCFGHCEKYIKLKKSCQSFEENKDFKSFERYNSLISLSKLEVLLDKIKSEIARIKESFNNNSTE